MDQSTRRTAYKLRFEDLGDLHVRVRKPGYRALMLLNRAVRTLGENLRGEHLDADTKFDAWGHLFDAFAASLIDWDLKDRGVPVPATRAGVLDQDPELLLRVAGVWYSRVVLRTERPARTERAAPTPVVAPAPSAEDTALLSIPVEIGNDALNHDAADAADDAADAEVGAGVSA